MPKNEILITIKTTIISFLLIIISNPLIAETYKCMYVCELYGEPVCKDEFYREGDKFNSSLKINFSYKENDDFLSQFFVYNPSIQLSIESKRI